MLKPIRVIGIDVTYKGSEISMYVEASTIRRAYPVYATRGEDGQMYRCEPDTNGTEVVAYRLYCSNEEVYTCSEETELNKIGLSKGGVKTLKNIGYVPPLER